MSQPGFFFYTGDWVKDTRVLSPLARGCWIDALCFLNENQGSVTWPIVSFANFWGVDNSVAIDVLNAIDIAKVGNVEWPGNSKTMAKLSNRRMLREISKRLKTKEKRSDAGKKGAAIRWQKCGSSESSSSSSSSDSDKNQNPDPATPAPSVDSLKNGKPALDERIKQVADRIYFSDRKKFARLIAWIKQAQRERFSDGVIATALQEFERYAATIENWYPYLDKIIDKVEKNFNANQSENQNQDFKRILTDYANEIKTTKR